MNKEKIGKKLQKCPCFIGQKATVRQDIRKKKNM